jgi:hypothetical protein
MAAVTSNFLKKVIVALKTDATIIANIAKDKNGILSVRIGNFVPTGAVVPEITVIEEELNSEPKLPATHTKLIITVWIDSKETSSSYSFLKTVSDAILDLFNREGGIYNEIDVPTNTGVRVCEILKSSRNIGYDEVLKYDFAEIIFEAVISEGESFDPTDAGNKIWV